MNSRWRDPRPLVNPSFRSFPGKACTSYPNPGILEFAQLVSIMFIFSCPSYPTQPVLIPVLQGRDLCFVYWPIWSIQCLVHVGAQYIFVDWMKLFVGRKAIYCKYLMPQVLYREGKSRDCLIYIFIWAQMFLAELQLHFCAHCHLLMSGQQPRRCCHDFVCSWKSLEAKTLPRLVLCWKWPKLSRIYSPFSFGRAELLSCFGDNSERSLRFFLLSLQWQWYFGFMEKSTSLWKWLYTDEEISSSRSDLIINWIALTLTRNSINLPTSLFGHFVLSKKAVRRLQLGIHFIKSFALGVRHVDLNPHSGELLTHLSRTQFLQFQQYLSFGVGNTGRYVYHPPSTAPVLHWSVLVIKIDSLVLLKIVGKRDWKEIY